MSEEIVDSRNNPTLKVSVYVGDIFNSFEVPSGASTGKYEACELRDDDGGMKTAIEKIDKIIKPALIGMSIEDQKSIDRKMIELDGTKQKTNLGGNTLIGVSIACAKTAALVNKMEVYEYLRSLETILPSRKEPLLYFNLINGGKHASSKLAFQEYHIVPQSENTNENIDMSKSIQKKLDEIILSKYGALPIKGDEGGIALSVEDVMEPLSLLREAVDTLGYTDKIMFAIDVASSSFYDSTYGVYNFSGRDWSMDDMMELYNKIINTYPIISIEDPFNEEDYESFAKLQGSIKKVKIVGDDLTVTNIERLQRAIDMKSIKAIIIKPNQIGTLSETLSTMKLARDNNIDCIVSHRSGETMDNFISDLAYAFGCYGIKAGALGPAERNIKYDRLREIVK